MSDVHLLLVQIGRGAFAFPENQVQQIGLWREASEGCVAMTSAMKLRSDILCERGLRVVGFDGRPLEFGVPANIRQRLAAPGSLTYVPKLLKRLAVPRWVAGFYLSDDELATVIDLQRLAEDVRLRVPKELEIEHP